MSSGLLFRWWTSDCVSNSQPLNVGATTQTLVVSSHPLFTQRRTQVCLTAPTSFLSPAERTSTYPCWPWTCLAKSTAPGQISSNSGTETRRALRWWGGFVEMTATSCREFILRGHISGGVSWLILLLPSWYSVPAWRPYGPHGILRLLLV